MTLRQQVETIWKAGVLAVDSATLVGHAVRSDHDRLIVGGEAFHWKELRRIVVVGAGKAGAGMANGLEDALGADHVASKVTGWINVPRDCVRPLQRIHLHPARPPGRNEPTLDGVFGSQQILREVASLTDDDLCLVLISGGGSALLPSPIDGISLEDKLAVTRFLMQTGATIQQLNTVRKRLSQIKGGGLLRAATAGRMIGLIISDVPNDPLDIIASGPTVCDQGTAKDALEVLNHFAGPAGQNSAIPDAVWRVLQSQTINRAILPPPAISCRNCIIGNNQTALDAATIQAHRMGFEVQLLGSNRQGIARDVGVEIAKLCLTATQRTPPGGTCILAGGEPVVKLAVTDKPRRGGRNQEVVLAATEHLTGENVNRIAILSGGTDGEDGPTDAAGAVFDSNIQAAVRDKGLDPSAFLAINDSYTFFEIAGGLLKTGPTHTNVMDIQIGLIAGTEK